MKSKQQNKKKLSTTLKYKTNKAAREKRESYKHPFYGNVSWRSFKDYSLFFISFMLSQFNSYKIQNIAFFLCFQSVMAWVICQTSTIYLMLAFYTYRQTHSTFMNITTRINNFYFFFIFIFYLLCFCVLFLSLSSHFLLRSVVYILNKVKWHNALAIPIWTTFLLHPTV